LEEKTSFSQKHHQLAQQFAQRITKALADTFVQFSTLIVNINFVSFEKMTSFSQILKQEQGKLMADVNSRK